jgi:hypothetical protein
MSSLKETIRRNFMTTLNATIDVVKENTSASVGLELADFLSDYGKEMSSLLYCYEFMTEGEHDAIVSKVNLILKTVKERQKSVSQR